MLDNNLNSKINNNKKRAFGSLTIEELSDALKFFENKCAYSETPINEKTWHLEHIIPVSMGGTTDSWNCIPICEECNLSKSNYHLLDWWDRYHSKEEEYKLEKIYIYITNELKEKQKYKITSSNINKEMENLQDKEEEISIDENLITTKKLDTFTFLFQLFSHLKENNKYIKGNVNDYMETLTELYNNNTMFEQLDSDIYIKQVKLLNYLKQINVNNHYAISYEYADRINDIDILKINIEKTKENLQIDNIGELINKILIFYY